MLRWNDWLGQSEREFAAADCLLAGGHYAWCCFTCQQAAEKALLERHAADHGGHNLRELLGGVETRDQPPGQVRAACRRLTRHYIPTRYPDAHPSGIPARRCRPATELRARADIHRHRLGGWRVDRLLPGLG